MEIQRHYTPATRNNKRRDEWITVWADIKFDDEECFCRQPSITLIAIYENPMSYWHKYDIAIGIRDEDDFDVGYIYKPTKEQFFDVLHELINWIHDLEMGCCCWDEFIKDQNFFPSLDCKREKW